MTSADVAAYYGVSEDTVRRWVRRGALQPATPTNPLLLRAKAYRFRPADVANFKPPTRRPRDTPPRPKTVPASIRYPAHVIIPLIAAEDPAPYIPD
jgi:hypothetical protein